MAAERKKASSPKKTMKTGDFEVVELEMPKVNIPCGYAESGECAAASASSTAKDVVIKFKRLNPKAAAPSRSHATDAGFDLVAVANPEVWTDVQSHMTLVTYHSGLAFECPPGVWLDVRSRSSVSRTGLVLANGVGTVDSGYRGEVKAEFYRLAEVPYERRWEEGDRFAQIIAMPGIDPRRVVFEEAEELSPSDRGEDGFGSTGK